MTLPLFLALHLVYGHVVALALLPRLEAEQEVLGGPLVTAAAPVMLLTAPIGCVLLRYAGGWFLHGAMLHHWAYERFHLGLSLALCVAVALTFLGAFLWTVAFATRTNRLAHLAPLALAAVTATVTLALDARGIWHVLGTKGRLVVTHPVGPLSLGAALILVGAWAWLGRRYRLLAKP